MKNVSLVMTLIGKDRPGLVASLAAIIDRHGGNWEESRMVELAGEFAGLLHVQVPAERAAPMAGGTMFRATARLRAPTSVLLEDLQQDLERIADDLMVDVDLEEPD